MHTVYHVSVMTTSYPCGMHHINLEWSGCMICLDLFTVSLHSPNGRHLPAIRAVQGDCQWPLIMWKFPQVKLTYNPLQPRKPQPIFRILAKPVTKLQAMFHTLLTALVPPGQDCATVYILPGHKFHGNKWDHPAIAHNFNNKHQVNLLRLEL